MTVSSAPFEQTSSGPPGARSFRANAFRVLAVAADAELKQIYRQQQRLLVALELDESAEAKRYGLLPPGHLFKEEILQAVHLLERPDDRLVEELFWVHEMDCSGDPPDKQLDTVICALRGATANNTTRGAVARHNLAVLQSILGQELGGDRRFDHWEEALKTWEKVIDDDLFWIFMEGRAHQCDCRNSDARMMRVTVCQHLASSLVEELANAVKSREVTAVHALAKIAVQHRSWLELGAALDSVGERAIKDGYASLGAILDRLSGLTQRDNKTKIQNSLVAGEKELRGVAAEYGAVVRSLGELGDADGWDDAVASSYQKLSAVHLNLLDDRHQVIRLIVQAREIARDPQLLQLLELDWQHVQRAILCREADALMQGGYLGRAEQTLAAALAFSTEEQKTAIKATQDRCRWARVLKGVDTRKNNPMLSTLNVVGGMFCGNRDYDSRTRSYATNHWLTFLFCPVFPLGAYRVSDVDFRSYCIHGKVPLPNFLRRARWAIPASVIVLALLLVAIISRGTSTKGGGSASSGATASRKTAGVTKTRPVVSAYVQPSERSGIEEERKALSVLGQSLEDRKITLDAEGANLDKQKGYLAGVASSYKGERVPEGAQLVYEALLADYNTKVSKYKRKLAAWKADSAAYAERVTSLNARVRGKNDQE
jgi:hypothetical protein